MANEHPLPGWERPRDRWLLQAEWNVEEWGQQDLDTLLLAAQEELGELCQAVLEARNEGGDPERIQAELDDLAPLLFQLQWAYNREVRADAE